MNDCEVRIDRYRFTVVAWQDDGDHWHYVVRDADGRGWYEGGALNNYQHALRNGVNHAINIAFERMASPS